MQTTLFLAGFVQISTGQPVRAVLRASVELLGDLATPDGARAPSRDRVKLGSVLVARLEVLDLAQPGRLGGANWARDSSSSSRSRHGPTALDRSVETGIRESEGATVGRGALSRKPLRIACRFRLEPPSVFTGPRRAAAVTQPSDCETPATASRTKAMTAPPTSRTETSVVVL